MRPHRLIIPLLLVAGCGAEQEDFLFGQSAKGDVSQIASMERCNFEMSVLNGQPPPTLPFSVSTCSGVDPERPIQKLELTAVVEHDGVCPNKKMKEQVYLQLESDALLETDASKTMAVRVPVQVPGFCLFKLGKSVNELGVRFAKETNWTLKLFAEHSGEQITDARLTIMNLDLKTQTSRGEVTVNEPRQAKAGAEFTHELRGRCPIERPDCELTWQVKTKQNTGAMYVMPSGPTTANLRWTPTEADIGTHQLTVIATTGFNHGSYQHMHYVIVEVEP